ncbi:hypothetical protein VW35_20080 [Devosia soli]|uniref:TonB C-terminal domain-containing protein n=1 Tax=Devosia soli TaxID=361041 RepID=A0A0F5L100_9HYPH|nr:hypothetical protein [Devosia soli]KKB76028.1 hypothetical protein VW35_20080 [Devosia soli]
MTRLAPLTALAIVALLSPGAEAQEVSQVELEAFVEQVKSCWTIAPADIGSGRSVKLRVALALDGAVTDASVIDPDKSEAAQRLATGAIRAVERCAPYSFSAESYDVWKTLEVDLQP